LIWALDLSAAAPPLSDQVLVSSKWAPLRAAAKLALRSTRAAVFQLNWKPKNSSPNSAPLKRRPQTRRLAPGLDYAFDAGRPQVCCGAAPDRALIISN
jgi:hypothetical protein